MGFRQLCVVGLLLTPARAQADALLGDVAAALNTAEAAQSNPATAAFLAHSEISYAPEIYKQETIAVRYPGFDANVLDSSGLVTPLTKPTLLFKLSPRLGIGGFYVPALPMKIAINKKNVPVLLIGEQHKVDINAAGSLDGLGVGMIGYRLSDSIGLGLGLTYQAVAFTASLKPSEGGAELANVVGSQSALEVTMGARVELLPATLSLGIAVTAVSHSSNSVQVNSPLINGGGDGGVANGGTNYAQTRTLTGALVGIAVSLLARIQLLLDLRYTKVDPQQSAYSLADLKEKKVDIHDTVSLRFGALARINSSLTALAGVHYEPATIGAGGRGDGSLAGYGTLQLVQVLAGLAPQVPYYMFSGGLQVGLLPTTTGRRQFYNQLSLEGGLTYTYSSLGINAKGELPGAYLDRRLSVPVGVTYRF